MALQRLQNASVRQLQNMVWCLHNITYSYTLANRLAYQLALCHQNLHIHTLPAILTGAYMVIISLTYHNRYHVTYFPDKELEAQKIQVTRNQMDCRSRT